MRINLVRVHSNRKLLTYLVFNRNNPDDGINLWGFSKPLKLRTFCLQNIE